MGFEQTTFVRICNNIARVTNVIILQEFIKPCISSYTYSIIKGRMLSVSRYIFVVVLHILLIQHFTLLQEAAKKADTALSSPPTKIEPAASIVGVQKPVKPIAGYTNSCFTV